MRYMTFVELLIVLAIVGIVGAFGAYFVMGHGRGGSKEATIGPDGKPALLIECSNSGDCVREAASVCPWGYSLVQQGQRSDHQIIYTGEVPMPVDTFSGALVIRCSETPPPVEHVGQVQ